MDWPSRQPHTPVTSGKGWREWRHDPEFVYIGLPGYGDGLPKAGTPIEAAFFGKPWNILKGVPKPDTAGLWRWAYRDHLVDRLEDPIFAGAVLALHGKTLVCWCKGKRGRDDAWCHGDLLAYAAERLYHNLP